MTNMSSQAHYDAADRLLEEAGSHPEPDTRARTLPRYPTRRPQDFPEKPPGTSSGGTSEPP